MVLLDRNQLELSFTKMKSLNKGWALISAVQKLCSASVDVSNGLRNIKRGYITTFLTGFHVRLGSGQRTRSIPLRIGHQGDGQVPRHLLLHEAGLQRR